MRAGEILQFTPDTLDDEGAGSGEAGGRRLHVAGALPGERIVAAVEHLSPHGREAWGRLVTLRAASPHRVAAACAAWGRCGGCVLQHLDYPRQLEEKRAHVTRALAKVGLSAAVDPCVASPVQLGYRNKAKLTAALRNRRVVFGAYAPRSHDVVDLAGCLVVEPPLDGVAAAAAQIATDLALPIYDLASGEGILRHLVLRRNHAGAILAVVVVARRGDARIDALAHQLAARQPALVGAVENLQPARSDVLFGDLEADRDLLGANALDEQVGGLRLRLSPRAFFQVNRSLATRLYADLIAALEPRRADRLVDVYSGIGGIALTLAPHVADVVGIEEHPAAVIDAAANAARNGIRNATFHGGDAAARLAERSLTGGQRDLAVLNPPRKGCAREVLEACAQLAPRTIAYVSCHPATLARDLVILRHLGYEICRVVPYDMLPHTPHVEALALLSRR